MDCPSRLLLAQFLQDAESTLQSAPWLENHLDGCDRCQAVLSRLTKLYDQNLLGQLLFSETEFSGRTLGAGDQAYRLEQCIGASSVYRAHRIVDGQVVAIKLFERLSPKQSQRVSLEIEIAATVSHPNVVKFLDRGNHDGIQFAVFEWIESNLAQSIATGVLPIGEAVRMVRQVAEAVQHLHSLGFIHRDLKPQNVLIDRTGQVKLADFGAAKDALDDRLALTTAGVAVGTPGFMAPEQTGLASGTITERTDVYGLGALLYALLTGQPPFKGDSYQSVLQKVLLDMPFPIKRLRPDAPRDLVVICEQCMRKAPDERYADAKDFVDDLGRYQNGQKIQARPIVFSRKLKRAIGQRPKSTGTAIFLILFAISAVAAMIWQSRQEAALRTQLAVDVTLKQLQECSANKMHEVYERATALPPASVRSWLLENSEVLQENPKNLVRVFAAYPSDGPLQPSSADWIEMLGASSLGETMEVIEQLESAPWRMATRTAEEIADIAKSLPLGGQLLNCCAVLAHFHLLPDELYPKLLDAIVASDNQGLPLVARAFYGCSGRLTEIAGNTRSRSLRAEILRVFADWNRDQPQRFAQVISWHQPHELTWLTASNSNEQAMLRDAIAAQLATVKQRGKLPFETRAEDDPMVSFALDHRGVMFRDFGYLARLTLEEFQQLQQLCGQHGWMVRSIATARIDGEPRVDCVIDRTVGSTRVEWSVPYEELDRLCQAQKQDGFAASSFWILQDFPDLRVDVLFSKAELISSEFRLDLPDPLDHFEEWDDTSTLTEIQNHRYVYEGESQSVNLSLITRRPAIAEDQSLRRVVAESASLKLDEGRYDLYRYIEQLGGNRAWVIVIAKSLAEHHEIAKQMVGQNYAIRSLKVDPQGSVYSSEWEDVTHYEMAQASLAEQAALTMALWELGDDSCLLKELRSSPNPSLTTELVIALSRNPGNISRIAKWLASSELSKEQRHQLLVALGMSNYSTASTQLRDDVLQQITFHLNDSDSAVHFAADWARRVIAQTPPTEAVVSPFDQARRKTPQDLAKIPHRGWFIDSNGIPFVAVRVRGIGMLGSEPDIPWRPYMNQHVTVREFDFAISAIEVPNQLFGTFLDEYPQKDISSSRIRPMLPSAPVTSHPLHNYLRFCRWLSDREQVEPAENCLPPQDEIKIGMTAVENFFELDGYRLPTQVEWEVAARAGAWTNSFWGKSREWTSMYTWTSQNTSFRAIPVGRKPPSPWGFFDILGNVYEISFFGHLFPFYGSLEKEGTQVSVRGGSYLANPRYATTDELNAIPAYSFDSNTGIRILRMLPPFQE